MKIVARGSENLLDSRLVEHIEQVRITWPAGTTYPPLAGGRDVFVLRTAEGLYGIWDMRHSGRFIWWTDGVNGLTEEALCPEEDRCDPERALQAYYRWQQREYVDLCREQGENEAISILTAVNRDERGDQ